MMPNAPNRYSDDRANRWSEKSGASCIEHQILRDKPQSYQSRNRSEAAIVPKPQKIMTIIGVGKPVPSQLYLMQLAGLVISGRSRVHDPTEKQIAKSKEMGHRMLCAMTKQDFGDDIEQWYEYLIVNDFGLTHPYGYGSLRKFLQRQGFAAPYKKDVIASMTSKDN